MADTGGFHQDQIKPRRLCHGHGMGKGFRQLGLGPTSGQRPHVDPVAVNGIHPDPVPQKGPAGLTAGGVARDHGNGHIRQISQDTDNQFVGQRGFPRPSSAGETDDRDVL